MKNTLLSLIALVALPLVSFAGQPASTPTVGFGGTAIPGGSQSTSYIITKSGGYYLAGDRTMTAGVSAIVVNAPDVTIDLNGCTISFTGGSTANGIEIPATSNVEIRNGSINDVPGNAISSTGGSGLRVIDVRVTTAGNSGVYSTTAFTTVDRSDFTYCSGWGVYVYSADSARITNSNVSYNGKSGISLAAVSNGEISNCHATHNQESGIFLNTGGCLVLNSTVSNNNIGKSATEGGIRLGRYSIARGNVVTSNWLNGIWVLGKGAIVEGNAISLTMDAAGDGTLGTSIGVGSGSAVYLRNSISPSTNAVYAPGGTTLVDGGGNNLF